MEAENSACQLGPGEPGVWLEGLGAREPWARGNCVPAQRRAEGTNGTDSAAWHPAPAMTAHSRTPDPQPGVFCEWAVMFS